METALVIGGTGPTGPFVVEGLLERGYDVTILHGGQHEVSFSRPVPHLHADPHFAETLNGALGSRTFDLVVAQYGRLRVIAQTLRGRAGRLVAIGAATAVYAVDGDERWGRLGRPALFPDSTDLFVRSEAESKLGFRMVEAMRQLFADHPTATYVGYPLAYGPRNPGPYDWAVVRRILDGRRRMVIADGGIKLESRVYAENAAGAVLRVIDRPREAAGKRYSVADEYVFSMRQRIDFIARHLGVTLELVDLAWEQAWPYHAMCRSVRGHRLSQSTLIRQELGHTDLVPADVALERTVDWLVANPLEPGGETERQMADAFDYAAEDDLMDRAARAREAFGPLDRPVLERTHQYRHPKRAGEAWTPPAKKESP